MSMLRGSAVDIERDGLCWIHREYSVTGRPRPRYASTSPRCSCRL